MEALTRAVWDFMEGAYRKGVLDDLLDLVGKLSDPEADLGEQLGNFEDGLTDADFGPFEGMSTEILTPLLQALAAKEVLESLHVLLITSRPLVDGVLERAGGDTKGMNEMLALVKQNLVCLKTVALALMPVLAKVYGPAVEMFIQERGGALTADVINAACAAINRNPRIATRMISDFFAVVDARLIKKTPEPLPVEVPLHIGLGPGFHAGENCHAVVETRRSHTLGRVFWNGTPQPDTGQPEGDPRRVLRAPAEGFLTAKAKIGDHLEEGAVVAEIRVPSNELQASSIHHSLLVTSSLKGVLRGLIHDGLHVTQGLKIGDIDPRDDTSACFLVSDKALAVGGGVLEAVMMRLRS